MEKYFLVNRPDARSQYMIIASNTTPDDVVAELPLELINENPIWLEVVEEEDPVLKQVVKKIKINETKKQEELNLLSALENKKNLHSEEQELINYLKSTDWVIIREIEDGIPAPASITSARQNAKKRINEIRNLLK